MEIITIPVGPYRTNCYLFHNQKEVWIIDPGYDGSSIERYIRSKNLQPVAVLLTHAHWDHILGLSELYASFPSLEIYVHPSESQYLGKEGGERLRKLAITLDPSQRATPNTLFTNLPHPTMHYDHLFVVPGCNLLVLHTPGHTQGSVSLYHKEEGIVFSGDTLFRHSIGRTDLPNSSYDKIIYSIKTFLLTLPKETKVFPGHGESTIIAQELQNPYLF